MNSLNNSDFSEFIMSRPLCFASCFFPLNDESCRWWLRLQDELDACGVDLVLLGWTPPSDPRLRVILVPLWLHGFGQAYSTPDETLTLESPLAEALVHRDRLWSGLENRSLPEFMEGLEVCQHVLRTILNELQPALVLVWGNGLPQSVVLQQLAVQQGRLCWVIERGLLPETLMVELAGQGAQTELNCSLYLQNAWRAVPDNGVFPAAQKYFHSSRATKYLQAEFLDSATFHQRHNPEGKKLIALLLQNDAASCLFPPDFAGARIHSPLFMSSADAIAHLAAVARLLDFKLLIKPHPMDRTDYSHFADERVSISREFNLHSLINAADVVAVMTSTAQYEALLYEKPILLLARSALSGKNIAYEPSSITELPATTHAALHRVDFPARMADARRFITFLLQQASISLEENVPAGSTLSDLARFLAKNATPPMMPHSLESRLASVAGHFVRWEATSQSKPNPETTPRASRLFEASLEIANKLFQNHSWAEAERHYQQLTGRLPNDLELWKRRVKCLRNQNFDVLADLVLEEALERHPEWAATLNAAAENNSELLVEGRTL